MRWQLLVGLMPLVAGSCKDEGSAAGDGGCPNLAEDCRLACGEGNVQSCLCVDGEPQITCKDGSGGGDGGTGDGDGGTGDGGTGDGGTGDGGTGDGGTGDGGTGDGDGGTDDGGTGDGGTGDGGTGDGGTSGDGVIDCEDLVPPAGPSWTEDLHYESGGGYSWFRARWTDGPWEMYYMHEIFDGAPLVELQDPPYVVTYGVPPEQGSAPAESYANYDDGTNVFQWVAIGGTSTVYEMTGKNNPTSGEMENMQFQEWEWSGPDVVLVPGGCQISLPDQAWEGIAG